MPLFFGGSGNLSFSRENKGSRNFSSSFPHPMTNPYTKFSFTVTHRDAGSKARCGVLMTPHGEVETPNFIFCATRGAMKGVTMDQVRDTGAEIILANTYHLLLQPGPDVVETLGGLHDMVGWKGPMMTDSGGFQIFSLGHGTVADEIKGRRNQQGAKALRSISEEGATFRSYLDGSTHTLTPEISIATQQKLGADLIFTLDECTAFHDSREYTAKATARSHRWEKRSLDYFLAHNTQSQALYGIVQGGVYEDLRRESTQFVSENAFFGQAIGGSLGGDKAQMHDIVSLSCENLTQTRPTHLLGIGIVDDILHGVACGIDTFDCVHPTRIARHGCALVSTSISESAKDHINLKNSRFKEDRSPIDRTCTCYCCRNFSRGYLHHLFKANEMTGGQLLTIHNIAFMSNFLRSIRKSIQQNTFQSMLSAKA